MDTIRSVLKGWSTLYLHRRVDAEKAFWGKISKLTKLFHVAPPRIGTGLCGKRGALMEKRNPLFTLQLRAGWVFGGREGDGGALSVWLSL